MLRNAHDARRPASRAVFKASSLEDASTQEAGLRRKRIRGSGVTGQDRQRRKRAEVGSRALDCYRRPLDYGIAVDNGRTGRRDCRFISTRPVVRARDQYITGSDGNGDLRVGTDSDDIDHCPQRQRQGYYPYAQLARRSHRRKNNNFNADMPDGVIACDRWSLSDRRSRQVLKTSLLSTVWSLVGIRTRGQPHRGPSA